MYNLMSLKKIIIALTCSISMLLFPQMVFSGMDSDILFRGNIYTLPDLYRIALERSEQIQISEEDLSIARQQRKMAFAVLVPSFSGAGSYTRYHENKSYGGAVIQPEWNYSGGLKVSQSFTLNGRELTALNMAETEIAAAKKDLYAVKESYLYQVASSYYDVLKSIKGVEIAQANVERLSTHLDAVAVRLEIEEVTKTALYRAQAELSQSESDLIRQENAARLAKSVLASVAGIDGAYAIRSPGSRVAPFDENLETLKAEALESRSDLKALEKRRKTAKKQIQYVRGAYWPAVSAEGGAVYADQEASPDVDRESLYLSLNINIPIYDGGLKRARVSEAGSQYRQAQLAVENQKKQIEIEIERVYLDVITYKAVLESLEDKLHYARENYDAVARQFKYGLANSIDVMDANTLLATTQQSLSESEYSYRLALLNLERVKGTFLKGIIAALPDTERGSP